MKNTNTYAIIKPPNSVTMLIMLTFFTFFKKRQHL